MTKTQTTVVHGRNGYDYDAIHVSGNIYIVGKYLVLVNEYMVCEETIERATKANIAKWLRRKKMVG